MKPRFHPNLNQHTTTTIWKKEERGGGIGRATYAVEVVARALAIEHAGRGVIEEAGGKVGNTEHLRKQNQISMRQHVHSCNP